MRVTAMLKPLRPRTGGAVLQIHYTGTASVSTAPGYGFAE
jgi:hypothetical protein